MAKRRSLSSAKPLVPLAPRISSRKHARKVTTAYHHITARMHAAKSEAERQRCASELNAMGGVEAYQQASAFNTSLFSTSRWVVQRLRARRVMMERAQVLPTVLEVGAINTQLLDTPGLSVRAIDLHSSEPRIEQVDFLTLPAGGAVDTATSVSRPYDVVVCSMVLNCVPDSRDRFKMLVGLRAQVKAGGLCFITVPRTCLLHSQSLTKESFIDCLRAVGLPPADDLPLDQHGPKRSKTAAAGPQKLAFFECVASVPDADAALRFQRARFECRRLLDAQRSASRRKSAGASFDVDLGGALGFGVRVPRSYAAEAHGAAPSRTKREQQVARDEFLRQCHDEQSEAASSLLASLKERGGAPSRAQQRALAQQEEGAVLSVEGMRVLRGEGALGEESQASNREKSAETMAEHSAERLAIDELARELGATCSEDALLDYARWSWCPSEESHGGAGSWRFAAPGEPEPATSRQAMTGWRWQSGGWKHTRPGAHFCKTMPIARVSKCSALRSSVVRKSGHTVLAMNLTCMKCWWRY